MYFTTGLLGALPSVTLSPVEVAGWRSRRTGGAPSSAKDHTTQSWDSLNASHGHVVAIQGLLDLLANLRSGAL
jgi:hypothetical protein